MPNIEEPGREYANDQFGCAGCNTNPCSCRDREWELFGSHVDRPDVRLVFSDEVGEDGLPQWERPA